MQTHGLERVKALNVQELSIQGTPLIVSAADLNLLVGQSNVISTADLSALAGIGTNSQSIKRVAKVTLTGNAIHAAVASWQNPEAGAIIINRVIIEVGTVAGASGTLSVGTTAVSATTSSANLLDTLDVRTATGLFDNLGNGGTGGKKQQKLAAGKWVTFAEASGNVSSMVGTAYIEYSLA